MERPTNGSSNVAVAATCNARKALLNEGLKVTRKYYRPWLVEVNLVGGGTLLVRPRCFSDDLEIYGPLAESDKSKLMIAEIRSTSFAGFVLN